MYFDLLILVVIVLGIIFLCRKFKNFVYLIACVDILLRILDFIKDNLGIDSLTKFIDKYLPASLPSLINKYTNDTLALIIMWCYIFIMIYFLCCSIKTLWKRK